MESSEKKKQQKRVRFLIRSPDTPETSKQTEERTTYLQGGEKHVKRLENEILQLKKPFNHEDKSLTAKQDTSNTEEETEGSNRLCMEACEYLVKNYISAHTSYSCTENKTNSLLVSQQDCSDMNKYLTILNSELFNKYNNRMEIVETYNKEIQKKIKEIECLRRKYGEEKEVEFNSIFKKQRNN